MNEVCLRSERLATAGFAHGFFTRFLGFSADGGARSDEDAAAAELGVGRERLYFLSQVHGRVVRVVAGEPAAAVRAEHGDITASAAPGMACGVRVADCAPVLIVDRRSGAVAAVHSGWRGTVLGAAEAGVRALTELGAAPGDLLAAIGPHIEACCFEVGPDVAAAIAASSPLGEAVVDRSREKPHVDLRRVIAAQLERAGVRELDHVRGCTMCEPGRFYSYRRDGKHGGRMLAAVVARSTGARSPGDGGGKLG